MQKESNAFAAFIGIDWADRKHDVCLVAAGTEKRERSVPERRPAVIRQWAEKLRDRFGGALIAVCLELTQGPIVSALLEHDSFAPSPSSRPASSTAAGSTARPTTSPAT